MLPYVKYIVSVCLNHFLLILYEFDFFFCILEGLVVCVFYPGGPYYAEFSTFIGLQLYALVNMHILIMAFRFLCGSICMNHPHLPKFTQTSIKDLSLIYLFWYYLCLASYNHQALMSSPAKIYIHSNSTFYQNL